MALPKRIYPHIRQFFGGKVSKKIFFLHIPKCGGISIHEAIRDSYGFVECIREKNLFHLEAHASLKGSTITGDELKDYREKLLIYYMSNDCCKYISGHFTYSEKVIQEFGKEWNFVTVLRHPVSRWFSQYFFNRYKDSSHFRIDGDLQSFLESEKGISLGSNYVRKLTDGISLREASSDEAVNQAIENLNNFALVGLLEKMDVFVRDYKSLFGAKLFLEHRNINPVSKSKQKEEITDEIRKKVEEICQPDIRVYESVLERIQTEGS